MIRKLLVKYLASRSRQYVFEYCLPNSFLSLCIHLNSLKIRLLPQVFEESGERFEELPNLFEQSLFVPLRFGHLCGADKLCHGFGRDAVLRQLAYGVGLRPYPFFVLVADGFLPRLAVGVLLPPVFVISLNRCISELPEGIAQAIYNHLADIARATSEFLANITQPRH